MLAMTNYDGFKGKRLLILGGASVHCKVVEAAKEMGVYTIVTDYLVGSPAKRIANESWMLSITDVDEIAKRCWQERVDGILNVCIDPAQIPYQKLCAMLQLPCFGTEKQFGIFTNKSIFKEYCRHFGVDTITTYCEEATDKIQYPVFVKPTDSRGSRGQYVCRTPQELSSAVANAKKESSNGEVIIEQYLFGKPDFSMTYFVCCGKPNLIRTCDRFLGREEDQLSKQCIAAIGPSMYSDLFLKKTDAKVRRMIQSLGIQYGPLFMQGFVDGETVRFYDPGFRFPGGDYELLLKKATGVDLMKYMVEFALTGQMSNTDSLDKLYQLNGMHTIQLDFTCRPGVIGSFIGVDEINACPAVLSSFPRYEVGDTVPNSGDVRQRVYEVGMLIEGGVSVRDSIHWVQSRFDILDEKGNSMLISRFDTNLLHDSVSV